MEKLIVNHSVSGYRTLTLGEIGEDYTGELVVIIDNNICDELSNCYAVITKTISNGGKVIIIMVEGECKNEAKAICMAAVLHGCNNIYKVNTLEIVDEQYIELASTRKPAIEEVQEFIGGDIAGYEKLTQVLMEIAEKAKESDSEGLMEILKDSYEVIVESALLVEYLKLSFDEHLDAEYCAHEAKSTLGAESAEEIEKLTAKLSEAERNLRNAKVEAEDTKKANERVTSELTTANNKIAELSSSIKLLESSKAIGGIIREYSTLDTKTINCKSSSIIYFKEVSYVNHMNSFVTALFNALKSKKISVKLLIYDDNVGISGKYRGVSVMNTKEYWGSKDSVLKSTGKYVVTEPSMCFIEDVVTSTSPVFEVVIVYDRLGHLNDIITGNLVTKVYVINSKTTYDNTKEMLKITGNSRIISGSQRIDGAWALPEIEGYSTNTEPANTGKYFRSQGSTESVMRSILREAHINF